MLRPERMSKVSVTGSRAVMPTVIETVYELDLVHLSDYDGSWQGFDNGVPIEGAEAASGKLVTVRALESTLDIESDEPVSADLTDDWEERLERVRTTVNELDDTRQDLREELRQVTERLDRVAPFAELGIDLDLLSGYEYVDVVVGEGDRTGIEAALEQADTIRAYETFTGGDVVAIVAAPAEDAEDDVIDDALVGVEFTSHEIPDVDQSPEAYVSELEDRKRHIEDDLADVDAELGEVTATEGEFLLRVEAALTADVQQAEAPLQFATTERSFVAEGWIPETQFEVLDDTLRDTVGERVEIEELERAEYTETGAGHGHGETDRSEPTEQPTDDESKPEEKEPPQRAVTDGGAVTMDDDPPVIQKNPKIINPFEVLVQAVNRPKYSELDPTVTLFVTFPLFFGLMIGDMGYGIVYTLLGYWMYRTIDSESIANFGGVVSWLGLWTILFGVLYGELFGFHVIHHPPLDKGLTAEDWAIGWVVGAVILGWIHLNVGYLFEFVEEYQLHDLKAAIVETGSWLLMLNGIWIWIFSTQEAGSLPDIPLVPGDLVASGAKPEFLFTVFDGQPFPLGFSGFPEYVGLVGLAAYFVGIALLVYGPTYELAEFLSPVVHALSYTRLTAVLLSKAGMALTANLLYFGAYQDPEGGYHFMHTKSPGAVDTATNQIVFDGLFHMGIVGMVLGLPVLILAHIVVLAIGGTAALQAIRLEYVEFFGKFYEGGGKKYEPFGTDSDH